MKQKIIAFTGTHGTGKSTSVLDCAKCLKISNPLKKVGVLMENVETCPLPINQTTTAESQLWIFTNQIQAEIAAAARCDILICDRTAVDSIAYTMVAGFKKMAESMISIVNHHMEIYRHIYFKQIAQNSFHFDDGFRDSADTQFRQNVEDSLLEIYRRLGFKAGHKKFQTI